MATKSITDKRQTPVLWEDALSVFPGGSSRGRKVRGKGLRKYPDYPRTLPHVPRPKQMARRGRIPNRYFAHVPAISDSLGGCYYSEDGKLRLAESRFSKREWTRLNTYRQSRLEYDTREVVLSSGKVVTIKDVVGLTELPLIERGHFYNVQMAGKKVPFYRDDLVEPADSQVKLEIYRKDIRLVSSAFYERRPLKETRGGGTWIKAEPELQAEWDLENALSREKRLAEEREARLVERVLESKEKQPSERKVELKAVPKSLVDLCVAGESRPAEWGTDPDEKLVDKRSGRRGKIKTFSRRSCRNLKFLLRNCLCYWNSSGTLTYPGNFPLDGRRVKRDLNLFLTHLRKDYPGIKYVWFLEFQARGAPHFHLMTSCPIPAETYSAPLWYSIVGSKDPRHLKAGVRWQPVTNQDDLEKYATSYAKKMGQKVVPDEFENVGRFWGSSRNLTSTLAEITDIPIAMMQELHRTYQSSFGGQGRVDTMNCYIWGGSRYGGHLLKQYYDNHIRPLIAQVLELAYPDVEVSPEETLSAKELLRELRKFGPKVRAGAKQWQDLTEAAYKAYIHGPISKLATDSERRLVSSVSTAYEGLKRSSVVLSEILAEEFSSYLCYLDHRQEEAWEAVYKPLYYPARFTHIQLFKDGRFLKRRYVPNWAS